MVSPKQFIENFFTWQRALGGLFAFISTVSIAWFGDQSYFAYQYYFLGINESSIDFVALSISFISFLIFSVSTTYLIFNYTKVRHLQGITAENLNTQMLIFTASPILGGFSLNLKEERGKISECIISKGEKELLLTGDLEKDISSLKKYKWRTSLQQIMRGLKHQRKCFNKIQKIIYVTNDGFLPILSSSTLVKENGQSLSLNHEDILILLTRFYLVPHNQFIKVKCVKARSRNDIKSYYEVIDNEIEQACNQRISNNLAHCIAILKENILVDITCAQVPGSVGATLATLHNKATIQYTESTDFDDFENEPNSHLYDVQMKKID